jgi:hypothetical protein
MKKGQSTTTKIVKPKISRPGVHSKTRTSNNKLSRNYKKKYRGQG